MAFYCWLIPCALFAQENPLHIILKFKPKNNFQMLTIGQRPGYISATKTLNPNHPFVFLAKLKDSNGKTLYSHYFAANPAWIIIEPRDSLDSAPPKKEIIVNLFFPPLTRNGIFSVEQQGKILLEEAFRLCKKNQKCEGWENYYSCPSDCSPSADDGICVSAIADGHCDPDCGNVDADCRIKISKKEKATLPPTLAKWNLYHWMALALVGLSTGGFLWLLLYLKYKKDRGLAGTLGIIIVAPFFLLSFFVFGILIYLRLKIWTGILS
ncbi:MAG: hypothetical protein Q7S68_04335 [Deltaproteobacteria bacterium]|nr:hypothetical protein [Deltaproteobacteria bacterium]